jgi:hypothetical protein
VEESAENLVVAIDPHSRRAERFALIVDLLSAECEKEVAMMAIRIVWSLARSDVSQVSKQPFTKIFFLQFFSSVPGQTRVTNFFHGLDDAQRAHTVELFNVRLQDYQVESLGAEKVFVDVFDEPHGHLSNAICHSILFAALIRIYVAR